ncbi:unnamed protein product [Brachionus calyciflorus]|uniref:Uncharacterized protein n=1 Tax=Brachionus calyciflorus TaxID=104777 RepID=A0A813RFF3_9BILA|nr:unnamed protein product [Brachionus calyciflorus]
MNRSRSKGNKLNNSKVSEGTKSQDKFIDSFQTNGDISEAIHLETEAVRTIERAWLSYRDKQMFRLLKHAVCAAEHSLSKEILRKVAPQESHLLNDPIFQVKIKFRFAGAEFPPFIVFKIFSQTRDGKTAKYLTGKEMIKANSTAAVEACNQMGNRQYYNLVIFDRLQQQTKGKVSDQESIVCLKDYMQYASVLDDMPAYVGGRSNNWRRLNLSDLPRYTIFYDVLNYAFNKKMSPSLAKEIPVLLKPPTNSDIQLEQIKLISKLEIPDDTLNPSITYLNSSNYKSSLSQISGRRSKNVLSKVSKMKKAYQMARSETLNTDADIYQTSAQYSESFKVPDELNDDFENEAKNLYIRTELVISSDSFIHERKKEWNTDFLNDPNIMIEKFSTIKAICLSECLTEPTCFFVIFKHGSCRLYNKYATIKNIFLKNSFVYSKKSNIFSFGENLNNYFTTTSIFTKSLSTFSTTSLPPVSISPLGNPYEINWGSWGPFETCDDKDYVVGFRSKLQYEKDNVADKTALNGVELICFNEKKIKSSEGQWDSWDTKFNNFHNRQSVIGFVYGMEKNKVFSKTILPQT